MKRGNTIFDPAEREQRLKDIEHERDRGRRQRLATDWGSEILRADNKWQAQKPKPPKRREEPPAPRPGPWAPL
jgi:hypothetical protein